MYKWMLDFQGLCEDLQEGKPKPQRASKEVLNAFMKEWWSATHPNPIDGSERLIGFSKEAWLTVKLKPLWGGIHIEWMQVIPGGERQGAATKALKVITDLADKHKVPMTLNAKPVGEPKIPKAKLKALYKKAGFVSEGGDEMRRPAKG